MRRAAAVVVAVAAAATALAGCGRAGDPLVPKLTDAPVDAVVVPPVDASPDAGPADAAPPIDAPDAGPVDAPPDAT